MMLHCVSMLTTRYQALSILDPIMNLHPFSNLFHHLVNQKCDHHFYYLTWFDLIYIDLSCVVSKIYDIHKFVYYHLNNQKHSLKICPSILHSFQTSDKETPQVDYLCYIHRRSPPNHYICHLFKIIAIFKRDAITKVPSFVGTSVMCFWAKYHISNQLFIIILPNNAQGECIYSWKVVYKNRKRKRFSRRNFQVHLVTIYVINTFNLM